MNVGSFNISHAQLFLDFWFKIAKNVLVDEAYQVARMVARYRFGEVLPELRIDDNML